MRGFPALWQLRGGFPTPVAHGGDPQDRAGSSAGDCVPRRGSRRVPEGGHGERTINNSLAPCPPIPHAPCPLHPMPNAQCPMPNPY
ncbi:MAG: hypothetical protein KME32_11140 [Mojavia pulchra JT2-VF2]|uniref:Uncharacterized protein n=1 Tax=Mojavia pulchra JT2-VF2 TaxID=287848 RepID=A0A951PWN4_9NOST|nr:hypothetical protein [Mojavia pulchra JT2-VF2]